MSHGSINVKLTISAQIADGEPIEIGTANLPVSITLDGTINGLTEAIQGALCGHTIVTSPRCSNHLPVQHRDGKPPWCRNCGKGHRKVA